MEISLDLDDIQLAELLVTMPKRAGRQAGTFDCVDVILTAGRLGIRYINTGNFHQVKTGIEEALRTGPYGKNETIVIRE